MRRARPAEEVARGVTERLLTAREVAEFLGFAPATVLDWFEAGRLHGFKLNGRAVRFRPSEIEASSLEHSTPRVRRGPYPGL